MPAPAPGGGGHADHGPALWVGGADGFRGCAFHLGGGKAVTAAHVVAGAGRPTALTLGHTTGSHPVTDARATPAAPPAERTRFHPYPDLALLTVPGCAALPAARLAPGDPPPGAAVTAVGYSAGTPSPGVQPDTLSLRVGGRSGAYLRVLGDGVREGFSGSMLVDDATGLVVGVLKGSRSYREVQGGWFTPVSALHAFLGPEAAAPDVMASAPATRPAPGPPPTDADLVEALLAFPALARADNRYELLDRMGDHLGLPYSFEVEERSARRDHLFRLVLSCRHFRDERAALRSLYTGMEEIVPHDKALDRLRDLVGRAVGGWEDA
jgi:hypothetical protein